MIFPTRCLLCNQPAPIVESALCHACENQVDVARRAEACPRCAATVAPHEITLDRDGASRCATCRNRFLPVSGMIRVGEYAGGLSRLIRTYKFGGREPVGPVLGAWLCETLSRALWMGRVEAIAAVPTHWSHQLRRPLHAAEALAVFVAGNQSWPCLPILHRVRGGRHQTGLSYTARKRNVRGAFALRRGVMLHGARLLLIDDVATTGATLDECARVLLRGGAAEVYAAVVAKASWRHLAGQAISIV